MRTVIVVTALSVFWLACSTDSVPDGPAGAVAGALDTHCGSKVVKVDPAQCTATQPESDGGVVSVDRPPMFNSEADDDDCKYHVKWSSSSISQNADVNFTVTLTTKSDGLAARDVPVRLEVFLDETHPAPNTDQKSSELTPGVYVAGPVRFDRRGRWSVRFHYNEQCAESETSPHGHAAFFVDVP